MEIIPEKYANILKGGGARKQLAKDKIFQYNAAKRRFVWYPYYTVNNPNTSLQQCYRNLFREAMQAWTDLEDKEYWERQAKGKRLYGKNLFVKWYIKNNDKCKEIMKHTDLTEKEINHIIDHAFLSVRDGHIYGANSVWNEINYNGVKIDELKKQEDEYGVNHGKTWQGGSHQNLGRGIACDEDKIYCAYLNDCSGLAVLDKKTMGVITTYIPHFPNPNCLCVDVDENYFYVGTLEGDLAVTVVNKNTYIEELYFVRQGDINQIWDINCDGNYLTFVNANPPHTVRVINKSIWNLKKKKTLPTEDGKINSFCILQDYIFFSYETNPVRILICSYPDIDYIGTYNGEHDEIRGEYIRTDGEYVYCALHSPNGVVLKLEKQFPYKIGKYKSTMDDSYFKGITIKGEYIYAGCEFNKPYVFKIKKEDMTEEEVINLGWENLNPHHLCSDEKSVYSCHYTRPVKAIKFECEEIEIDEAVGIIYDGIWIYYIAVGTRGYILRYDIIDFFREDYKMTSENETNIKKVAWDNEYMYLAGESNNAWIAKYDFENREKVSGWTDPYNDKKINSIVATTGFIIASIGENFGSLVKLEKENLSLIDRYYFGAQNEIARGLKYEKNYLYYYTLQSPPRIIKFNISTMNIVSFGEFGIEGANYHAGCFDGNFYYVALWKQKLYVYKINISSLEVVEEEEYEEDSWYNIYVWSCKEYLYVARSNPWTKFIKIEKKNMKNYCSYTMTPDIGPCSAIYHDGKYMYYALKGTKIKFGRKILKDVNETE